MVGEDLMDYLDIIHLVSWRICNELKPYASYANPNPNPFVASGRRKSSWGTEAEADSSSCHYPGV